MRKVKCFISLLKERDWLEEMARQGWLLKNLTLGFIYDFEKIEPTQKVYEVEHFGISMDANAQKHQLLGRKNAIELANEMGWEVATYDEGMNYYFVKDKAGDESDEFYDDDELRHLRAERYRKAAGVDQIKLLTLMVIFEICFLGFSIFCFREKEGVVLASLMILAISLIFNMGLILFQYYGSEKIYHDLCMTREQWEEYKQNREKHSFFNVKSLLKFLQKKDQEGLKLVCVEKGKYVFEKSSQHYEYYADTKLSLKRRRRKQKQKYETDYKDLLMQSTIWYEQSIAEAEAQGLEVVCSVASTIIYRRKVNDAPIEWESKAKWIGKQEMIITLCITFLLLMLVSYLSGFTVGRISRYITDAVNVLCVSLNV